MFLKRRPARLAAVFAALAVGAPLAVSSATAAPAGDAVVTGPTCPDGYSGPTNLATGCPWYLMAYTVQYPGQPAARCPVALTLGPSFQGAGASLPPSAATGSPGGVSVADACAAVAAAAP